MELRSGARSVSELVDATGLKQPNVSNHLAKLRNRGLVKASKIGRQVYYSLAAPEVEAALIGFEHQAEEGNQSNASLDELCKQYARFAVSGNEAACTKIIDQLIRQSVPLVRIYQQVLAEAMQFVGKWYEVEAIDVGQEHLASAITERMMARVVHFAPPARSIANTAIVGCVAGNWHSLGARMISDFMRIAGWNTLFLGPNVPDASFLTAIKEHQPKLVLFSVAFEDDLPVATSLIRSINDYRKDRPGFIIGVGGRLASIVPEEFIRAGADFTAPNLMVFSEEVLPRIENNADLPIGVFSNHKKVD